MSVQYDVDGGFANLRRSMLVGPRGAVTVEAGGRTHTGRVDSDRASQIRRALDDSGLFTQDHSYPPTGGADLQRHVITYRGHTVVVHDNTVPKSLEPAMTLLNETMLAHLTL